MSLQIYNDLEQGSDAWLAARLGMVTASTVGQLLEVTSIGAGEYDCPTCMAEPNEPCISVAKGKTGALKTMHPARTEAARQSGATRVQPAVSDFSKRLTLLLVCERITGVSDFREQYVSNDMLSGQLDEPLAREVYSGHYAEAVECGFMVRDDWGFKIGYSPDGVVGDDGLIEVKSPRAKEHLRTILADEVPDRYMPQCQTGLLVSGREWIDYLSFYGGMPLYRKRVYPDPQWAEAIINAVDAFEQTAAEMTKTYDLATRGLPATEPRIDLSTLYQDVI